MSTCRREERTMFVPELLDIASAGDGADVASSRPWSSRQSRKSRVARAQAARVFADRCVADLEANADRCQELIEQSLAMCTSLAPKIGYDQAAAIAKEAYASGKTVRQVALEKKVLPEAELDAVLDPRSMTEPA